MISVVFVCLVLISSTQALEFIFDIKPPNKEKFLKDGEDEENLQVTANSDSSDWNEKVIQAMNQVDDILLQFVPKFQGRINETHNIVSRIKAMVADRSSDAEIIFADASKPFKVSLEMLVTVKNLPTYNNTHDQVKLWVADALNETIQVLPALLNGTEKLQAEAQSTLNLLSNTLKNVTADKLRIKCFPSTRCLDSTLKQVIDQTTKTSKAVKKLSDTFLALSISSESVLYAVITKQRTRIAEEARSAGLALLANNNVDKDVVNSYFVRYHIVHNKYNRYVQSQLNKTLNCIYEYDYRNVKCRNLTRNSIGSSVYPVIDAYNLAKYTNKNRSLVMDNLITDTKGKANNLFKTITPKVPNYQTDIAGYLELANYYNTTIQDRTTNYVNETLGNDHSGDLIDWYLYLDSIIVETNLTFLDFTSVNLNYLLQNCTNKITTSTIEYNKWIGGTLPAAIDEFHAKDLEIVAENVYRSASIAHKDIFYMGSMNLNAVLQTWKPKLEQALNKFTDIYNKIKQKDYNQYSISEALLGIVSSTCMKALDNSQSVISADVLEMLNRTALVQLVQTPSEEYLRLVRDTVNRLERNNNQTVKYFEINAKTRSELESYLKKGIQSYTYHRSPLVEHSHVLNVKVYSLNVNYSRYVEEVTYLTKTTESIDQGLDEFTSAMKTNILEVCKEYSVVVAKYAKAVQSGSFVGTIPSAFPILARRYREKYLAGDSEADPNSNIDLPVLVFS